jgi:hypothetical protein
MARKTLATIRLDAEDVQAMRRARKDGFSTSELVRRGLRIVAAKYYGRKRAPKTGLFVSTDRKLGDESELFRQLLR